VFQAKIDLEEILIGKIDFEFANLKVDVKTRDFPKELVDLILFEKDFDGKADYYFLITLNEENGVKWAYFVGGITKMDFLKKMVEKDYGYGKRYAVNVKDLSFKELI
jgi:hypothetical protein